MSSGARLELRDATELARQVSELIAPTVVRSKCVGSIRRRKPTVGDIEFVLEPSFVEVDLLGTEMPDVEAIEAVCQREGWTRVKGGTRMLQYTDVIVGGVTLDLYLAHPPAEWGSLVAIRTGPKDLGTTAMARIKGRLLKHVEGRIIDVRTGEHIPTPEEEDFFRCAELPCVPPQDRQRLLEATRDRARCPDEWMWIHGSST